MMNGSRTKMPAATVMPTDQETSQPSLTRSNILSRLSQRSKLKFPLLTILFGGFCRNPLKLKMEQAQLLTKSEEKSGVLDGNGVKGREG